MEIEIGYRNRVIWAPCNFSLWGTVNISTSQELKDEVRRVIGKIKQQIYTKM